jgi:hypothetical protein
MARSGIRHLRAIRFRVHLSTPMVDFPLTLAGIQGQNRSPDEL